LDFEPFRPAVRVVPSSDAELRVAAETALAAVDLGQSDRAVADALAAALRRRYPNAGVVPVDPIAKVHGERAWYVYRNIGRRA
jgi:hypothetical protein